MGHSIEGVLNKLDPRVVHLSVRSPVRPHDAAIAIASQKNKWSITLFFDSMFAHNKKNGNGNGKGAESKPEVAHKDALTALDYIMMNRVRVRRRMMAQISKLVLSEQSEATQSTTDEVTDTATESTGKSDVVESGARSRDAQHAEVAEEAEAPVSAPSPDVTTT